MFDSFREKLHSVQGSLNTSIRVFGGNDLTSAAGQVKTIHCSPLNFSAGTELLERFQSSWAEIHSLTADNAKEAVSVDVAICELHKRIQSQKQAACQATTVLSKLPEVILEVDLLSEKLGDLNDIIVAVEKSLINLENLIETRVLQDRQLEQRFQLALYKEHKLNQLEQTRVALAREHAEKVALHEARQQRVKQERQEAFEQQFKQDLNAYKATNALPKVTIRNPDLEESKLEEIFLDAEDSSELDEFLHEATPERTAEEKPNDSS